MTHPTTILLVDDDDRLRDRLARAFAERGLHVLAAGNYTEALRISREHLPDRAVIDLRMPGPSGFQLIKDLLAIHLLVSMQFDFSLGRANRSVL